MGCNGISWKVKYNKYFVSHDYPFNKQVQCSLKLLLDSCIRCVQVDGKIRDLIKSTGSGVAHDIKSW